MRKYFLFVLILAACKAEAQSTVKGKVYSGKESLVGANVFLKDTYDGASTDAKGEYKFTSTESGEFTLVVSCVGFENAEKKIQLNGKEIIVDVALKEKANELNTVTITAGTFEAGADIKKAMILSSIDIATTAGAEADIYSAIQTLPGAQAANQEEGLFVRGGAASETKTLFDGLWVQKPFMNDMPNVAQRGRFSAFEFKGTTFSSGAYSAQYGQALSSVLVLDSKDIAEKTTSDFGIMTAGLSAGHTHRFKTSSLNLNVSYFNLKPSNSIFPQNFDWLQDPNSIALGGNYRVKTSATGLLKIFNTTTQNKMKLNRENLDPLNTKMLIDNNDKSSYTNITYQEYINDDWKFNVGYASNLQSNIFKLDSNVLERTDYLHQARMGVNGYINKKLQAKVGLEYLNQWKEEIYNTLDRNFEENLTAAYAELDYYFTYKWVLRAGARAEHSSKLNQVALVPRLSMAYKPNKVHQYSIAYGKFVQNPVDDYMIQTSTIGYETSEHYLANYQFQTEKYVFRVEAYRKNYTDLVLEDKVVNILNNDGYGYAQGFDLFWRDRKTIKRGDYWISYSYLDTKRKFRDYPVLAQPSFAATHTFNIVYKEYIPKIQTQIAATYTYASGRTYRNPNATEFLSNYTKDYHNFSVNASYLTSIKNHFTIVFLSMGNVFGIKNEFGYEYSNDGSRRRAIEPNAPRSIFLGVFISIGDDNVLN
jgi:CarboxypepD_reg-like domain/TonB dependent receptor